jgi:hypothetical protein
LAAAGLLASALALLSAAPAWAAEDPADESDQGSSSTWSVRPGDSEGNADGRSWVELSLDPGAEASDFMVVSNYSDHELEFSLKAADGYFNKRGRFNMLTSSEESVDAGAWISIPASVTIPAHATQAVRLTVRVPANATPGDHPAGVAASVVRSSTDESGAGVGLEARVGFRVMVRVLGELDPALRVEAQANYLGAWNPFSPGRVQIDYTVTNSGNTRLGASPSATVGFWFGTAGEAVGEPVKEFAPGESRSGSLTVARVWPWGILDVEVLAAGQAIVEEPGLTAPLSGVKLPVVAVPWSQLALFAAALTLVVAWWRGRRRRAKQLAALLEGARQEGRREAAQATPTPADAAARADAAAPAAVPGRAPGAAESGPARGPGGAGEGAP